MRHRFGYLFLLPVLLFLGACHSTPDHAQYIPQNALMVAEVNTKELSKKIAWSMITGSSLLDKLRGHSKDSAKQSDFIKNMSEAGVDELNTFYVYAKSNGDKTPCFVALIPLKDARKWETFLKKTFDATVKEAGKRKEAKLTDDIYAGWTNNLLIVVSVQENQLPYAGGEAEDITPELLQARTDKEPLLMSLLESAFNVTKETSLLEDKRFSTFENKPHDFGFWVNLEAVMNNYGSRNIASLTGGFSPSSSMWKNSAFSAATNFEKGRVVTDLLVYSPEEVKEINEEFAKNNIDNDIVDRVPAEGLDYLMAYRLAPAGIGKMLQKMGVNGLAEGLLKEYNLSLNEVLGSITGDLVFSMNNFSQQQETVLFDSTDATSAITNYKMDMDMLFALKLSNKASFMKLINLGQTMEMLKQKGPDTYALATGGSDSSVIVVSDKYAVFSNKERVARAYINNNNRKSTMMAKDHIYKHPFGMFFDYQAWSKGMSMMTGNKADSIVFAASRRTFDNYVFNGGTFANNTIKYQMSINFVDKKENSLLQLLDFAKSIQEADAMRQAELESLEADMAGEADSVLQ